MELNFIVYIFSIIDVNTPQYKVGQSLQSLTWNLICGVKRNWGSICMYSQRSFRDVIHWHSWAFAGASLWKAKLSFENQGIHVISGSRSNTNVRSRFLNVKDHVLRAVSHVGFSKTKTIMFRRWLTALVWISLREAFAGIKDYKFVHLTSCGVGEVEQVLSIEILFAEVLQRYARLDVGFETSWHWGEDDLLNGISFAIVNIVDDNLTSDN